MSQFIDVEQVSVANMAESASVASGEIQPLRTLLLVSEPGTISDPLIFAIEREFPSIRIAQVGSVEAALASFEHPVSLILVEAAYFSRAEAMSPEFVRLHPSAFIAVIEPDSHRYRLSLSDLFGSDFVRGVLPMNLKLDVWLSVIRLLLRGGEYFPSGMIYQHARGKTERRPSPLARNTAGEDVGDLTQREMEVLELVSFGLQNKTIAAELQLSEHTVKIHLHNIISKLRAHNRTEAAAWFRDHQARTRTNSRY